MREAPRDAPGGPEKDESVDVLRAKYHDYCSARVAEVLLGLSPDEMYVLAERAAREAGLANELSYEQIVQLSTELVSRRLDFPPFEIWAEQYRADPSRFESELIGLWKTDLERPEEK